MSIDIPQNNTLPVVRRNANDEPIKNIEGLAAEIWTDWSHVRDDRRPWIQEVLMDDKFVMGQHWTETERAELRAKAMPDYITNLIFPAIQASISHAVAKSPAFLFTHPSGKDVTHLNELLSHIFRISTFKMVTKKTLYSCIAKSAGYVYVYEDSMANNGLGEVKIALANIRDVYVPKHCHKWDWSDASHIYYSFLVPKEALSEDYNISEDKVDDVLIGYDESYMDNVGLEGSLRSNEEQAGETRKIKQDSRKEYGRIIIRFRYINVSTRTLLDLRNGSKYVFEREDGDTKEVKPKLPRWANTEEVQAILTTSSDPEKEFIAREGKERKVEVTVTAGWKEVVDQYILDTDIIPVIPIYYWDTETPFPYSLVHFIEQQQKIYNLADSAMLYNAQAGSFPKQMMPAGAMGTDQESIDKYLEQSCLPNGVMEYQTDPTLPDGGKPTIIQPMQLGNTFPLIKQEAAYNIEKISGEFGIGRGDPKDAPDTFRGMATLLEKAKDRTKEFGDSIDNFFERVGKVVYDLSRSVYTYPMVINRPTNEGKDFRTTKINTITWKDKEMVVDNGVFNSTAEIAIKPGSYAPTYRYIILSALEMMLQQGYPVADMIIDYIDLPDEKKDELKKRLEAQNDIKSIMNMLNKSKKDLDGANKENIELLKHIDIIEAQINVAKAEGKMLGDIEATKRETKSQIKDKSKDKSKDNKG